MIRASVSAGAIALAIACAVAASPARAADYDMSTWDGFYVGAHAGYGWFDASGNSGTAVSLEGTGLMGGVLLGYNWDLGTYVAGIEADASFGNQSDQQPAPGFGTLRLTNHGQHTFRARLGMETGTSGLLYVTGGLALADYWASDSTGAHDKDFLLGGVVGAGYEFGPSLHADAPVVMAGGGAFGWQPGEWTDDTQMALAILLALAEGVGDLALIEAGFREFEDTLPHFRDTLARVRK